MSRRLTKSQQERAIELLSLGGALLEELCEDFKSQTGYGTPLEDQYKINLGDFLKEVDNG